MRYAPKGRTSHLEGGVAGGSRRFAHGRLNQMSPGNSSAWRVQARGPMSLQSV